MSPHDEIVAAMVKLRNQLYEYIQEFDPPGGQVAFDHVTKACIYATHFVDEEKLK